MPFDNRAYIIAADDHLNEISSTVTAMCVHSATVKVSTQTCDEVMLNMYV
jgi:hypothetical protein